MKNLRVGQVIVDLFYNKRTQSVNYLQRLFNQISFYNQLKIHDLFTQFIVSKISLDRQQNKTNQNQIVSENRNKFQLQSISIIQGFCPNDIKNKRQIINRRMSTEDYSKKVNQATKAITAIRKDIKYRQDEAIRGQTTYSIDAEIRGQITQLQSTIADIQKMVKKYEADPKDFNLNSKQLAQRRAQFDRLFGDKNSIKRTYDSFFQKKANDDIANLTGQQTFKEKHNTNNMSAKQLKDLKEQQQKDQDAVLDDLIDTVRNIKTGNKGINKELNEQDILLNDLEAGIDDNSKRMGKTKRQMMKLLDKSSNCCLITTIVVQIAGIVCLLVLWP